MISILALLAVLAMPSYHLIQMAVWKTGCLSNLHQLSIATRRYAMDNDDEIPRRAHGSNSDRWPQLLEDYYEGQVKILVDPREAATKSYDPQRLLSKRSNQGSFFMNGMNDLGAYTQSNVTICLDNLKDPSQVILFAQKKANKGDFYMDFVEGNQNQALETNAYEQGSNYAFADGSARYLKAKDYKDSLWITNPQYKVP